MSSLFYIKFTRFIDLNKKKLKSILKIYKSKNLKIYKSINLKIYQIVIYNLYIKNRNNMDTYEVLDLLINLEYFSKYECVVFNCLNSLSHTIYKNNYSITKNISATRTQNALRKMDIYILSDELTPTNSNEFLDILNITSELLFKNINPRKIKNNHLEYRNDRLNPLKNIPYFRKNTITKQIENSIWLKLSLSHGDRPSDYKKLQEIMIR